MDLSIFESLVSKFSQNKAYIVSIVCIVCIRNWMRLLSIEPLNDKTNIWMYASFRYKYRKPCPSENTNMYGYF